MSPLEAILKIKAMFAEAGVEVPAVEVAVEPAAEPVEAAKEYQLKSGVTVVIDKLEAGGKVDIKAEDGSLTPAPAGEHEMADGMIIVVDENAIISEIKEAAAPETEVEVEAKEEEKKEPSEAEMLKEKIAKMEEELAMMKKKQTEMEAANAKFQSAIPQLTDIVIGLMQTPSAEPTEAPKNHFNKHVESHTDKVSKFLALAKSIKK